ncbi:HD-GYP domain-containing protein (c-di-GMP phosphodiesterase class II) [Oceanotoga teriensis]|uniref:HD-GYP domain-containing protein (C-di-GMP phosphodiesterase class II) n=1 Tax=Oceanotoga teriensis TaxID=515440 RepID=A0AA45HJD5_9BACT|nr:HD-GYP domain-containing protein [Oceanotoga teriensis]PWJ95697.1 HD-GYP domain-containing protein (c-di-GMP phosphodiesterase class II) [Oceanotoga teriensis]
MRFKNIFNKTARNMTLQNIFLVVTIILLWFILIFFTGSKVRNISKNNINSFDYVIDVYKSNFDYLFKNDIGQLPDIFNDIYILNDGEENKNFVFNRSIFETLNKEDSLFLHEDKLFLYFNYTDKTVVAELNKDNLIFENSHFFYILNENNDIIIGNNMDHEVKIGRNNLNFQKFKFYFNEIKKINNLFFVTSIDISLESYIIIFYTILSFGLLFWNIRTKYRSLKLLGDFETEFSQIISSIELLLKELRNFDNQSISIIPEVKFDGILDNIKNKEFKFEGLKELKEVEEITLKEFIELLENLSASYEEITSSNDELESLYRELEKTYNKLEDTYINFSKKLSKIAEKYDDITGKHIERVAEYSVFISQQLNMNTSFTDKIHYFAPLHDIGKLLIDKKILNKEGRLTKEEFEEMKKHTLYAAEILGDDEEFEFAKNIALYHHEKYNGKGYPFNKSGEEIPLEARIISLADVYDSLRSPRSYKPSFSHEKAYDIIVNGDWKTSPDDFDPKIMKIFKENHEKFNEIYESYKEDI